MEELFENVNFERKESLFYEKSGHACENRRISAFSQTVTVV